MPTNKLAWDAAGEHFFERGVDHGVLYVKAASGQSYGAGVVWNGLTAVTESPEGAEVSTLYADNIPYLNLMSAEAFKATIEAYTYPDEFEECQGNKELVASSGVLVTQQDHKGFGFCYRTRIGNDVNTELGYKIHLVYGALAAPTERANETINDSPDAMTMSWEITTIPVEVNGMKPTAHLVIDSTKANAAKLALLEAALYGTDDASQISAISAVVTGFEGKPTLLLPADVVAILGIQ